MEDGSSVALRGGADAVAAMRAAGAAGEALLVRADGRCERAGLEAAVREADLHGSALVLAGAAAFHRSEELDRLVISGEARRRAAADAA